MEFNLRPWKLTDVDSLIKHANNPNISAFMTDQFPYPYTEENAQQFIKYAMQGNPSNILAIEVKGEAAGGIGIHPQDGIMRQNAELGYWLSETYWGNNIISRAVQEIIPYAFEHWEINRLYARPFSNNPASQRVLEKNGFILEAHLKKTILKRDEVLDELIYGFRKQD